MGAVESPIDAGGPRVWTTRPVAIPTPQDFRPFPRAALDSSIPALFVSRAAAAPDRPAIRFADASTSYGALDRWSNEIARRILSRTDADNRPVGLFLSQGPALIAAILGCLKANKIYVPLDAALPFEHVKALVADAKLQLTIADKDHAEQVLAICHEARVLDLPHAEEGHGAPVNCASRDSLAYVYYTSGTTGRPKGVVDTHANVLHNVMRYTNSLRISASDRLTLLQALMFSGAISSMFAALLNGGTLCPWDFRARGLAGIASWLNVEEISIYHSVPSIFRAIASEPDRFDSIRVIRLEGDQATKADFDVFKERFSRTCVLVNGLGATECGLVRQYCVDAATPVAPGPLPIGYPVEDVSVAIVGDDGKSLPYGEIGEIVLTSNHFAVGYWNSPGLTGRSFQTSPNGDRSYRTGDLGRMGHDGCLTLFGRKDLQHKIRGMHVDIAAVEAALLQLSGVRQAAARTLQDERTGAFLCGYVVADADFDAVAARGRLRALLPDPSVPSHLVELQTLPLDANGKVKRADLPNPRFAPQRRTKRPLTPVEAAVLGVWESILARSGLDPDDEFVALGGDSLQAMRLGAAIDAAMGISVPVAAVFGPLRTAALMAAYVKAARSGLRQEGS